MSNLFDRCSQEYERFRPSYPPEMYDRLVADCVLGAGSRILDVGAGPGKASLPFIERGIPTISADLSLPMILQGLQSYRNLRCVCCAAEALPFAAQSFDLLTSAQSFHWFDVPRVLPEFARVLRARGFLAVYWNTRDPDQEHIDFFENLAVKFNPEHIRDYRARDQAPIIETGGFFRIAQHMQYRFTLPMSVEDWVGLARSISYIRVIGDENMPTFETALREGISRFRNVDCPYITNVWLAETSE